MKKDNESYVERLTKEIAKGVPLLAVCLIFFFPITVVLILFAYLFSFLLDLTKKEYYQEENYVYKDFDLTDLKNTEDNNEE